MNSVNLTPNNNVVTGTSASQNATVVSDLSAIDDGEMINIYGGIDVAQQGKKYNNTWQHSNVQYIFPQNTSQDNLVFLYDANRITIPEDFTLHIPLTFSFIFKIPNPSKPNGISDLPQPYTDDTYVWNNMLTKRFPLLDLFKKVDLKLGANNLSVMGNITSSNDRIDKEGLKYKLLLRTFTSNITNELAVLAGHPYGNNIDNSKIIGSSTSYKGRPHLNELNSTYNELIIKLYYLAFVQYAQLNKANFSNDSKYYYLTVNVNWPLPLYYLHEFFDNNVFLPLQLRFRLDLALNNQQVVMGISADSTGALINSITTQIAIKQDSDFYITFMGKQALPSYLQSFNDKLTMRPLTVLLNNVIYKDLDYKSPGKFSGSFLTQEQLPRRIMIQIYYNGLTVPIFDLLPGVTLDRNLKIYNFQNSAMAGFVLDRFRVNMLGSELKENSIKYPPSQTTYFPDPFQFLELKYQKEMQEKPTFSDIPVFLSNSGNPAEPFNLIINLDPTYEARLGDTTLLNGNTNASLEINLNCLDSKFTDWSNVVVRVIKFTEYQLTYDVTMNVSIIQSPMSVGKGIAPIMPMNIPGPQVSA